MPKRKSTSHWVDRMCEETENSINGLARKAEVSPGFLGNCKNRNTPVDGIVSRNKKKLANAIGISENELDILYK